VKKKATLLITGRCQVPHLTIPTEISAIIGRRLRGEGDVVDRERLIAFMTKLRELENKYDEFKSDRNKDDDRYFDFHLNALDPYCVWHSFHFVVDDSMADGLLYIATVDHKLGKF
jgi:hypothetical protein